MIKAIQKLPEIKDCSVEFLKIKFAFNSYFDIANFWVQDNNRCIISMLDGDAVIRNAGCDIEEVSEFLKVIKPNSVFSDEKTLKALKIPFKRAIVMKYKRKNFTETLKGDEYLSSGKIYEILKSAGFNLPKYEVFAADYCHRLNHGFAESIGIRDVCVAVLFKENENVLINGIASLKKGYGTKMLGAIAEKCKDKNIFALCEEKTKDFYIKNGFCEVYKAGYGMVENELF